MKQPRQITIPCTITIAHDADNLEAHVELDGGVEPGIGDRVLVHGDAVKIVFGERIVLHREATLTRATVFQRLMTYIKARFELAELYEVSFSGRRL
ncbi:MAG: hypothetical protein U5J99_01905 [Parvularculaceae bacterium]|nr:hypothetical protein [Parvularculaceae bacterium]